MIKLVCVAAAALALAVPASAQPITAGDLMQHIEVLADDSYEGRAVGTAGGERTEAYILEAFAKAGLKPGMDHGWRQEVRMVERVPVSSSITVMADGRTVTLPAGSSLLAGKEPRVDLPQRPLIFAGYGLVRDLLGVDVRNTVVLMIPGEPPEPEDGPHWQERRTRLIHAGAGAVLTIQPADQGWPSGEPGAGTTLRLATEMFPWAQGLVTRDAAIAMLSAGGRNGAELLAAAERADFRAVQIGTAAVRADTDVKRYTTANIVGKVEGTDRAGEAVVLMGHWDHTGYCRPEGAPDRICNGAIDNASGIAVLIEAAEALAAGPKPERSVYFVATTLEESGGFRGATAFATQPPEAIDKVVAVLNVDSTAIHPAGLPVAILGRGRFPALDTVIDATARSMGRRIDTDDEANIMIERQDGWAFTQRGIPSVMASGSFSDMKILFGYLESSYHQPNDDLGQNIELGGTVEDANLHVNLLRALADPEVYAVR